MNDKHEKLKQSSEISNVSFFLLSLGVVVGMFCLVSILPLFLASIGDNGPYFVLVWNPFVGFLLICPVAMYRYKKGLITEKMRKYTKFYKIILMGFCDSVNNLILTFASPLQNTPGALQAILQQIYIPLTVLISKFVLKKPYSKRQYLGCFISFAGCFISLIPIFSSFEVSNVNIFWPIIYAIGIIPAGFQSIMEESIFEDMADYDFIYLLTWDAIFQFLFNNLFFWIDIIPGFGVSSGIENHFEKIGGCLKCIFNPMSEENEKCKFALLTGLLNVGGYLLFFTTSTIMFKYASATASAIVSALAPALSIYFFIIFKDLNTWAGGEDYTLLDILFYSLSLVIIVVGVVVYRIGEKKQIKHELDQIYNSKIESDENDQRFLNYLLSKTVKDEGGF